MEFSIKSLMYAAIVIGSFIAGIQFGIWNSMNDKVVEKVFKRDEPISKGFPFAPMPKDVPKFRENLQEYVSIGQYGGALHLVIYMSVDELIEHFGDGYCATRGLPSEEFDLPGTSQAYDATRDWVFSGCDNLESKTWYRVSCVFAEKYNRRLDELKLRNGGVLDTN